MCLQHCNNERITVDGYWATDKPDILRCSSSSAIAVMVTVGTKVWCASGADIHVLDLQTMDFQVSKVKVFHICTAAYVYTA